MTTHEPPSRWGGLKRIKFAGYFQAGFCTKKFIRFVYQGFGGEGELLKLFLVVDAVLLAVALL